MKKMHGFIGMPVRVCAFVVALGFIGCDFVSEVLGLGGGGTEVPEVSPKRFAPELYATLWYVKSTANGGDDGHSGTTPDEPFATVGAALTAIQDEYGLAGTNWTGKAAGIVILDDMTIGPVAKISGAYPPLVLMGKAPPGADGPAKGLQLASNGSLITVGDGVSLTLWNITLTGKAGNNASLVVVGGTVAELVLESGAVIMGNVAPGPGGVLVNSGGTLTMKGGTISGNKATGNDSGGVRVNSGGKFTMESGEISGNIGTGTSWGGGVAVKGGEFTMTGGFIRGNICENSHPGGGVFVNGGAFTMSDGEISGNKTVGSGVHSYGGGVAIAGGTFDMTGGTISGNTTGTYGGGVAMNGGTFTMKGGVISGNTAVTYGGGVGVNSGTFTKADPLDPSATFGGDGYSGIIYGSNETGTYENWKGETKDLKNTSNSSQGHVAYVVAGTKTRTDTADENYNLDSTKDKDNGGGWD